MEILVDYGDMDPEQLEARQALCNLQGGDGHQLRTTYKLSTILTVDAGENMEFVMDGGKLKIHARANSLLHSNVHCPNCNLLVHMIRMGRVIIHSFLLFSDPTV
jgi:hypothetical protein